MSTTVVASLMLLYVAAFILGFTTRMFITTILYRGTEK